MASQYEHKLRPKAEEFICALQQAGISGEFLEDTLRDYSVKVAISQHDKGMGKVVIHYSSKKDSCKLATNELADKTIESALQDCWYGKPNTVASEPSQPSTESSAKTAYHIYVDGSFLNDIVGYGAVVVKHDSILGEISGRVDDMRMRSMHQVGGEITAVKKAIEWCHGNSVYEVDVFYDYAGVEKWVTGEWRAKNEFTQEYAKFVPESGVTIHWHKVKSHSGDRWNDKADELAKLGSNPATTDTSEPHDFETELNAKAQEFVEFLANKEMQGTFDRIVNSNCAKIKLFHQHRDAGYFNLWIVNEITYSNP